MEGEEPEPERDVALDGNMSETLPTAGKVRDKKFVSEADSGCCGDPILSTSKRPAADGDRELPPWCSRPFCRSNTQSEPEDFFCGSHGSCSSDGTELNAAAGTTATALDYSEDENELPECHRGCPEYYYLCSRGGSANTGELRDRLEAGGSHFGSGKRTASESASASTDSSTDHDEQQTSCYQVRSSSTSLGSGLSLLLFVAIPMLARHLGALISKRLLARLYRS